MYQDGTFRGTGETYVATTDKQRELLAKQKAEESERIKESIEERQKEKQGIVTAVKKILKNKIKK